MNKLYCTRNKSKYWQWGKIWKLREDVQTPYSITNTEGIKLENRSDIQEYTKL